MIHSTHHHNHPRHKKHDHGKKGTTDSASPQKKKQETGPEDKKPEKKEKKPENTDKKAGQKTAANPPDSTRNNMFEISPKKKGLLLNSRYMSKEELEAKKAEFVKSWEKGVENRMSVFRKDTRRNKLIDEAREAYLSVTNRSGSSISASNIDRYIRITKGLAHIADLREGKAQYTKPFMMQQDYSLGATLRSRDLLLPYSKEMEEEYLLGEESVPYCDRKGSKGWYALDPQAACVTLEQAKEMGSTELGRWFANNVASNAHEASRRECLGYVNDGLQRIGIETKKEGGVALLEPNRVDIARDSIERFQSDCHRGMFVRIMLPKGKDLDSAIAECPSGTIIADDGGKSGHIFVVRNGAEENDGVSRAYTDYKQGTDYTLHDGANYYAFYPVGAGTRKGDGTAAS